MGDRKNSSFLSPITYHLSLLIDCAPASGRFTVATFVVGMKGGDVIERDLFAGMDVAEGHEEDVAVSDSHVAVRGAGVVDVVRAVAAPAAVQTPV